MGDDQDTERGFLGEQPTEWFLTDFELLQLPQFAARYRPYEFRIAVPPQAIERRPLPGRVDRIPELRAFLYLRSDSAAVERLRSHGKALSQRPE